VWESVGTDLQLALAEQKARQAMVTNEAQQQPATTRKTLASAVDMEQSVQSFSPRTKCNHRRAKKPVPKLSPDKSGQKVTSVWPIITGQNPEQE
jgi:hypothetical protein